MARWRRRSIKAEAERQTSRIQQAEGAHGGRKAAPQGGTSRSGKRLPKQTAGLEESGTRLKVKAIVILESYHRLDYLLEAANLPRSTFSYHQKRLGAPDKNAELKDAILESFERNKHRYGYGRILLDLRNQG